MYLRNLSIRRSVFSGCRRPLIGPPRISAGGTFSRSPSIRFPARFASSRKAQQGFLQNHAARVVSCRRSSTRGRGAKSVRHSRNSASRSCPFPPQPDRSRSRCRSPGRAALSVVGDFSATIGACHPRRRAGLGVRAVSSRRQDQISRKVLWRRRGLVDSTQPAASPVARPGFEVGATCAHDWSNVEIDLTGAASISGSFTSNPRFRRAVHGQRLWKSSARP